MLRIFILIKSNLHVIWHSRLCYLLFCFAIRERSGHWNCVGKPHRNNGRFLIRLRVVDGEEEAAFEYRQVSSRPFVECVNTIFKRLRIILYLSYYISDCGIYGNYILSLYIRFLYKKKQENIISVFVLLSLLLITIIQSSSVIDYYYFLFHPIGNAAAKSIHVVKNNSFIILKPWLLTLN